MGIKERKEREKQRRTTDILAAAQAVFETKGVLNTTLQDVAKSAEISVGLIYRYFESKEDIFASLALQGAETFDTALSDILKKASVGGRKRPHPADVLTQIAERFFVFYSPYGDYFDMLLYSYKGMNKKVKVQGSTVTKLMSVTLNSLDQLKEYLLATPEFKAKDEDEALRATFLLWGMLLGLQKLFDSSGRGHLFAFGQPEFIRDMVQQIFRGIANPETASGTRSAKTRSPSPEAH